MPSILEKLFGSSARVKIIRLFLLNPEGLFDAKEISRRCKIASKSTRKEISFLEKIGFIKHQSKTVGELIKLKNGKIKNRKKKISGLKLREDFPLLCALKSLFLSVDPVDKGKMVKALKALGKIKLIVFSGIFIRSDNSRVDLLLVGDAVRKGALERVLRKFESETGKDINYALLDTKEFLYRLGMHDRFIHDIFDYPHEKILNKLGI